MIALVRVDNRLLHGQILEAWIPRLGVTEVVVADDEAAASDLARAAMTLCVPPDLPVRVVPVAAVPWAELAAGAAVVLVLLRDVAALAAARAGGLTPALAPRVNLGNVHFGPERRPVTPSVFLAGPELDALRDSRRRRVRASRRAPSRPSPPPGSPRSNVGTARLLRLDCSCLGLPRPGSHRGPRRRRTQGLPPGHAVAADHPRARGRLGARRPGGRPPRRGAARAVLARRGEPRRRAPGARGARHRRHRGGAVLAGRAAGAGTTPEVAILAVLLCAPLALVGRKADRLVEAWNERLALRAEAELAHHHARAAVRANLYGLLLPFTIAAALAPVGAAVAAAAIPALLGALPGAAAPLRLGFFAFAALACASGAKALRARERAAPVLRGARRRPRRGGRDREVPGVSAKVPGPHARARLLALPVPAGGLEPPRHAEPRLRVRDRPGAPRAVPRRRPPRGGARAPPALLQLPPVHGGGDPGRRDPPRGEGRGRGRARRASRSSTSRRCRVRSRRSATGSSGPRSARSSARSPRSARCSSAGPRSSRPSSSTTRSTSRSASGSSAPGYEQRRRGRRARSPASGCPSRRTGSARRARWSAASRRRSSSCAARPLSGAASGVLAAVAAALGYAALARGARLLPTAYAAALFGAAAAVAVGRLHGSS